jgi:hypothetical protein
LRTVQAAGLGDGAHGPIKNGAQAGYDRGSVLGRVPERVFICNASQDHAYLQRAVLQFFNDAAISGKGAS